MENTDCKSQLVETEAFLEGLSDGIAGREARRKGRFRFINRSYDSGYIKGAEIRADTLRVRHK